MTGIEAPPSSRSSELDAASDQAVAAQIIAACNAAIRTLRIYSTDNKAVRQPLGAVLHGLTQLNERHPKVVIAYVEGLYYLGDTRVRLSGTQQAIAEQFATELDRRAIGGITFEGILPESELLRFFSVLGEHGQEQAESADPIRLALREAGVSSVSVSRVLKAITEDAKPKTSTARSADVFAAAIRHAAALAEKGGQPRIGSAHSRRIVHELVNLAQHDASVLLALAGLRGTGSDAGEHLVAVTILSVVFGKRLGLDKHLLADLGMAAMYHDCGLGLLEPEHQHDVARHPVHALKSLMKATHVDDRLLRQLLVGFEHHLDFAGGGQPKLRAKSTMHTMSQIVRLANDFDGFTRGRNRRTFDVPTTVARMERNAGTLYHPGLLRLFADMVGGVVEESEPESVEPEAESAPASHLDLMLADFLDKKEEVEREAAKPKPKPAKKAKKPAGKPRSNALGVLKLKKIRKPHAAK